MRCLLLLRLCPYWANGLSEKQLLGLEGSVIVIAIPYNQWYQNTFLSKLTGDFWHLFLFFVSEILKAVFRCFKNETNKKEHFGMFYKCICSRCQWRWSSGVRVSILCERCMRNCFSKQQAEITYCSVLGLALSFSVPGGVSHERH